MSLLFFLLFFSEVTLLVRAWTHFSDRMLTVQMYAVHALIGLVAEKTCAGEMHFLGDWGRGKEVIS